MSKYFDDDRANIIIGIDASRSRSGGAKAHLIGLLTSVDPRVYGIKKIHLWVYRELAGCIPDYPWLEKHVPKEMSQSLIRQIFWQYKYLPKQAKALGCEIILNTDAGSVNCFYPSVTISQDMLSFEPGEMARYRFTKEWLRLFVLKHVQAMSLKKSDIAIFLTYYAANTIQKMIGKAHNYKVIPHGVGSEFFIKRDLARKYDEGVRVLYVSNTAPYKHQWHVVNAISMLRHQGINVTLLLVGGGVGRAQKRLEKAIKRVDPNKEFIEQHAFVAHDRISRYLASTDIFVFASSCENMPVTLLEAMASRLPIASSDRGPMPEILRDGGVYFNPEDSCSIAASLRTLIIDGALREQLSAKALQLARQFSWEKCAIETFLCIRDLYDQLQK